MIDVFTTADEAIERVIIVAIEAGGAALASEYDLRAIFDATFAYDAGLRGFVQTADENEFWAAVMESEI